MKCIGACLGLFIWVSVIGQSLDSLQIERLIEARLMAAKTKQEVTKPEKKWFDHVAIRGYTQVRYNQLFQTNENLGCEQCDRSWSKTGGFSFRRVRVIFFGQVSKNVYFYIQPDFASTVISDRLHVAQLRDAYFDIGFDPKNEFRVRIGQSKIPFGFENLQSSQNRLPLDRADGTNSAATNERDLGLFFYYAPKAKRELFSKLVSSGLKGSGDYGIVAFGAYNGQGANSPELSKLPHIVARVTWPFEAGRQILETGIQAYSGNWVMPIASISPTVKYNSDRIYADQRVAASFTLYPQPFGIQTEYNFGKGPQYNTVTNTIDSKPLQGGYILMSYQLKLNQQVLFPFSRYQYFKGGKKFELDARSYSVKDLELGVEWQPGKNFELVAMYVFSKRRYEDFVKKTNQQKGSLLRLQAQLNF